MAGRASLGAVRRMQQYIGNHPSLPSKVKDVVNHPAGPFTIHFWAPTMKWGLVIAGLADLRRPAEDISRPQNMALATTGIIWSRYATQIIPVNYNLLSVNVFVAATGCYQLYRSYTHEQGKPVVSPVTKE